ncbi:MAG: hypothetical protein Q9170_004555 [Blastenia crenularia]
MSTTRRTNGAAKPFPRSSSNPATRPKSPANFTLVHPSEILLLLTYPALLLLGSLFSLLDPSARNAPYSATLQSHPPESAPNYFALKRNVFNQYFVKVGWFWFSVAWAVWVGVGVGMVKRAKAKEHQRIVEIVDEDEQSGGEGIVLTPQRLRSILRWAAVTVWWVLVTQWCFGPALIDRGFRFTGGACEIVRDEAARQEMGDIKEFVTAATCKIAGGQWKGGHDISGHVFILALGSASVGLEVLGALVRGEEVEGLGKWGWGVVMGVVGMNKTSSAELSEAINSMYRWYKDAEVCYAYLVDVTCDPSGKAPDFERSRWFKRGWTLQELLAPETLVFYDQEWKEIGTKLSLQAHISHTTRIPAMILTGQTEASVAARMSWAASRRTTRVEDIAYCLMGLFDVNMPLLYGEGPKAFMRLQEMILRSTNDESLFAWKDSTLDESGMFARSPEAFAESGNMVPIEYPGIYRAPSVMTNRGLEMDLHLEGNERGVLADDVHGSLSLPLNCAASRREEYPILLRLKRKTKESYVRSDLAFLFTYSLKGLSPK